MGLYSSSIQHECGLCLWNKYKNRSTQGDPTLLKVTTLHRKQVVATIGYSKPLTAHREQAWCQWLQVEARRNTQRLWKSRNPCFYWHSWGATFSTNSLQYWLCAIINSSKNPSVQPYISGVALAVSMSTLLHAQTQSVVASTSRVSCRWSPSIGCQDSHFLVCSALGICTSSGFTHTHAHTRAHTRTHTHTHP